MRHPCRCSLCQENPGSLKQPWITLVPCKRCAQIVANSRFDEFAKVRSESHRIHQMMQFRFRPLLPHLFAKNPGRICSHRRRTWARFGHKFTQISYHHNRQLLQGIFWCREGGRTLAAVANTQVTDSRIDRIAQIARSDNLRYNLGTKTLAEDSDPCRCDLPPWLRPRGPQLPNYSNFG
jgi:hypothetical protein